MPKISPPRRQAPIFARNRLDTGPAIGTNTENAVKTVNPEPILKWKTRPVPKLDPNEYPTTDPVTVLPPWYKKATENPDIGITHIEISDPPKPDVEAISKKLALRRRLLLDPPAIVLLQSDSSLTGVGGVANAATFTLPGLSSAPAAGSLLIVTVSGNQYADGWEIQSGYGTWLEYDGWNSYFNGPANPQQKMWYKIADGTETGNLTVRNDNINPSRPAGLIMEFSGVDQTTPFDITPIFSHSSEITASDGTDASPALTPLNAGSVFVTLQTRSDESTGTGPPTIPTGYTTVGHNSNSSATSTSVAYKVLDTIEEETPTEWGASGAASTESIMGSLLLRRG